MKAVDCLVKALDARAHLGSRLPASRQSSTALQGSLLKQ